MYMIEQRVAAVVHAVCLPIQHCEHEQVNAWSESEVRGQGVVTVVVMVMVMVLVFVFGIIADVQIGGVFRWREL